MSTPHIPTAAQLTKLATLGAALSSAEATFQSAQGTLATAQAAYMTAQVSYDRYLAYIYGGPATDCIDRGGQNVT